MDIGCYQIQFYVLYFYWYTINRCEHGLGPELGNDWKIDRSKETIKQVGYMIRVNIDPHFKKESNKLKSDSLGGVCLLCVWFLREFPLMMVGPSN